MSLFRSFKKSGVANRKADEILYTVVAREMDEGTIHEGLWLMALERANGVSSLQTAEYVKLRVQSLRDDISIVANEREINTLEEYQTAAALSFEGNPNRVTALIAGNATYDEIIEYFDKYDSAQTTALINSPDDDDSYPIHIAVKQGRADIVKWLLIKGASLSVTNTWGSTPLDLARKANNTEMIAILT